MRYDEISKIITASSAADWARAIPGGFFLHQLGEVSSDDRHWLEVSTHDYLVVNKADIDLRLAWGMTIDRDLHFQGMVFADQSVDRLAVDVFWRGALVARWTVLLVDGGRCYLPDPAGAHFKTGEGALDYETAGWTATTAEVKLARLLQDIVRPAARDFDSYMQQAGIVEVSGETLP